MTNPTYTRADLEMAVFLATRIRSNVIKERTPHFITDVDRYDQITEEKLRFLRASNNETRRAA